MADERWSSIRWPARGAGIFWSRSRTSPGWPSVPVSGLCCEAKLIRAVRLDASGVPDYNAVAGVW